jgi:RNA polymerase sigma-70 factor (ECF subfamily)
MATTFENFAGFVKYFPAAASVELADYQATYDEHKHRVYALSFWMTDNEMVAERLLERTFARAFAAELPLSADVIDDCLIAELRELMPIGELTLNCGPCTSVSSVRRNTRRVHLERAVVLLPATEKMIFLLHDVEGYDAYRVADALDLTEDECRRGLHQARLRIRQLLEKMVS